MGVFKEMGINGDLPFSRKKRVIIDADSILYTANTDDIDGVMEHLSAEVAWIKERCGARSALVLLSDSKENTFRVKANPQYKANRKPPNLPISEFKKAALERYSNVMLCKECEADDIANYFARRYKGRHIVASIDKDVLNASRGIYFDYRKNIFVEVRSIVDSTKFLAYQMLRGDNADGIKGIPGVGDKKALQLLWTADKLNVRNADVFIDWFAEVVWREYRKAFGRNNAAEMIYLNEICLNVARVDSIDFDFEKQEISIKSWKPFVFARNAETKSAQKKGI